MFVLWNERTETGSQVFNFKKVAFIKTSSKVINKILFISVRKQFIENCVL